MKPTPHRFFVQRDPDPELLPDSGRSVEASDQDSAVRAWAKATIGPSADKLLRKEKGIWSYWGCRIRVRLDPPPRLFTGFCQETSGTGTIWIESVPARNLRDARKEARLRCADAWGWPTDRVHVLGIAEGEVKILHWEDLNT